MPGRGRPFRKGQSGNSAGRPPVGLSIAEYTRKLAGDDGRLYVDQLHAIATEPRADLRARLAAISLLLDRGFGKAPQDITLRNDDQPARVLHIDWKGEGEPEGVPAALNGRDRTASADSFQPTR